MLLIMRKIACLLLGSLMALPILAQQTPLWMRYPGISPDGKTIVFSYKGDLYKVNSSGGDGASNSSAVAARNGSMSHSRPMRSP